MNMSVSATACCVVRGRVWPCPIARASVVCSAVQGLPGHQEGRLVAQFHHGIGVLDVG